MEKTVGTSQGGLPGGGEVRPQGTQSQRRGQRAPGGDRRVAPWRTVCPGEAGSSQGSSRGRGEHGLGPHSTLSPRAQSLPCRHRPHLPPPAGEHPPFGPQPRGPSSLVLCPPTPRPPGPQGSRVLRPGPPHPTARRPHLTRRPVAWSSLPRCPAPLHSLTPTRGPWLGPPHPPRPGLPVLRPGTSPSVSGCPRSAPRAGCPSRGEGPLTVGQGPGENPGVPEFAQRGPPHTEGSCSEHGVPGKVPAPQPGTLGCTPGSTLAG